MLFNSVPFLLFLPLVVILYYLLPPNKRWFWLLLASYYFYGSWNWAFLGLLFMTTAIDFFIARSMEDEPDQKKRKRLLIISICANLGVLIFFKYTNFFLDVAGKKELLNIVLPVGISFYTFQSMSYTIDVYRKEAKAERSLRRFALFVSYFPQLVAGPIERFEHLNGQLKREYSLEYSNFSIGFRYLLYGFFIKLCIADNTAYYVDLYYADHKSFGSLDAWISWAFFGFQIYSDFYGYSLIAKGSAKLMGVDLMDNFRNPYFASSITRFWQRWHISLSTWFKDYLYIPLGGNRVNYGRWIFNILVVFTLSGLWHGANYTFLIWGALHGLIYILEKPVERFRKGWISVILGWMITYFSVHIAWVFFRSPDADTAFQIIKNMFSSMPGSTKLLIHWQTWFLLSIFVLCEVIDRREGIINFLGRLAAPLRWSLYFMFLFLLLSMGGTANHPFIYFQF